MNKQAWAWFAITRRGPVDHLGRVPLVLEWQMAPDKPVKRQTMHRKPGPIQAYFMARGFAEKPGRPNE